MTLDLDVLSDRGTVHGFFVTASEYPATMTLEATLERAGFSCTYVRGNKMQTVEAFMNELSAAMQFPLWFGENWNAVDDCIGDVVPPSEVGFVLVFRHSEWLLSEDLESLPTFVSVMSAAMAASSRKTPPQAFLCLFVTGAEQGNRPAWMADFAEVRI